MWSVPPGYRVVAADYNLVNDALHDVVARPGMGMQDALRFEDGSLTYFELRDRVLALAAGLSLAGVAPREHVLLRGANSREFAISFLALVHVGAIPVLVHSLLATPEIEYIIDNAEIRWVLVDNEVAAAVRAAVNAQSGLRGLIAWGGAHTGELAWETLAQSVATANPAFATQRDDPAFFVYTSGTTGRPKGIVHAHRWLGVVGDQARLRSGPLQTGTVSFSVGEMSSISALGHGLLYPLRNGGIAAFIRGRAVPERVLDAIERFKVNLLFGTPTLFRMLLALDPVLTAARNLSSLNVVNSGGEPAGAAMKQQWESRFPGGFYEYFGISEVQILLANGPGLPYRNGSVGVAFPDSGVTVLNDALEPAKPGEIGHLAVPASNPGLFLTYYKRPEQWRQAFRGSWYISGDLFERDADGYFWFHGRADDVFKSRGYSISPLEIETALLDHAAVHEAVVVPVADARIGNAIHAVVVPKQTPASKKQLRDELIEHLRQRIAPYKLPREIEFRDDLPRHGAVTKISRRVIAAEVSATESTTP